MTARATAVLRRSATALVCLMVVVWSCQARAEFGFSEDRLASDFATLSAFEHRLAGSPEGASARAHIMKRLQEIGIERVFTQPVRVLRPVHEECTLRCDGEEYPLRPMRANLAQPPVSGEEPIRGESLYAGSGLAEEYGNDSPEGRIVVLDFNTAERWEHAFAYGARAVLFVESENSPVIFPRHIQIPADIPRFYIEREVAERTGILEECKELSITARARWESFEAANIVAWIPGTDPVFALEEEEILVISAPIDTFGPVPQLTPGARGAANCAALLELAAALHANPVRRSVVIAFLDGEAECLSGSRALYHALFRGVQHEGLNRTLKDLEEDYLEEQLFLEKMVQSLHVPDPFDATGEARMRMLEMLREEARHGAAQVSEELRALRLARDPDEEPSELERELDEKEDEWSMLRRCLAKGVITEEARPLLEKIRTDALDLVDARQQELREKLDRVAVDRQISELVTDEVEGRKELKYITLHLCMNLSDGGPTWGIVQGGDGLYFDVNRDHFGMYNGVFRGLRRVVGAARDISPEAYTHLDEETLVLRSKPRALFPCRFSQAGQVASVFGVYGVGIMTCHDRRPREGLPCDTAQRFNLEHFAAQAAEAVQLVLEAADSPEMSLLRVIRPRYYYEEPEWLGDRAVGLNVMTTSVGSAVPNRPARDVFVGCPPDVFWGYPVPGMNLAYQVLSDYNGNITLGPMSVNHCHWGQWMAAELDPGGVVERASNRIGPLFIQRRLSLFSCRMHTVVSESVPRFGVPTLVLRASSDALFRDEEFNQFERRNVITFFVPDTVPRVKLFNPLGLSALLAGPENPTGVGVPVGEDWERYPTLLRASKDLWALNEDRLEVLRSRQITNDSLEYLHGVAGDYLSEGEPGSRPKASFLDRKAALSAAVAVAQRVWGPLLSTLNDLVKAVVILLILTIPFAYGLERLLVGTPHIYRRIGWYIFFFVITFLVLYMVHPAFSIATSPIIIFLAFFVILLSALVVVMLVRRFRTEVRAIQGLQATVHTVDVSRIGTIMAAVGMGISTMRRRPLRTLLTAVTVILLTFSILSFASFDAQQGVLKRYIGMGGETEAVFIHNVLYDALEEQFFDTVRGQTAEGTRVGARYWLTGIPAPDWEDFEATIASENGSRIGSVAGIVGLDKADLEKQTELAVGFPVWSEQGIGRDEICLPDVVAKTLKVTRGDDVYVSGRLMNVVDIYDATRVASFRQVDGSSVLPVDYEAQKEDRIQHERMSAQQRLNLINSQMESSFLTNLSAGEVAFAATETVRQLGGRLVAISVYPEDKRDLPTLAEELARLSPAPVFANLPEGAHRLYFSTLIAASGLRDLLIPILLGGLIVFGTMLGSVSDREQEIYAFSALGLAPRHVSMLFFAEASVYAVIGGLGGYILAQVVTTTLSWLATYGVVSAPEMNCSSTNAIFAMFVVMATVMLSTIYPAMKASRSANPGVQRIWRLPRPDGDEWSITFPFTVSQYDLTGVVSFLHEHFENFSDSSLGVFMARDGELFERRLDDAKTTSLGVRAKVWLAPFDLGVSQDFQLFSIPGEIPGINEIHINLRRLSGTHADWRRGNRTFVDDLRRQLLIWRSLAPETMEIYRQRTLEQTAGSTGEETNG